MIRRAEKKDIPAVLRLLLQVDMVHHKGRPDLFRGPATKYTAEELEKIFADDDTPVFVSVGKDGEVEGHAFCIFKETVGDHVLTDIKTLYIDDICVFEHLRGRGIGSALYRYAVDFAKQHGCYNVTLNVWECNPGARRFYEKCGMKPQKTGMETIL